MAVNLSVWIDAKSLENYVFNTVHVQFYRKREKWFDLLSKPHMVFWWVPEGYLPTLDEAWEKLQYFEKHGASDDAFGWAEVMSAEHMRGLRCA
jgi:hypothetical protein